MKTLTFSLLLILATTLTAFAQERTDETRSIKGIGLLIAHHHAQAFAVLKALYQIG